METRAKAKFIRISPRKARLVADLIRGLPLSAARQQLQILPKRAAALALKVLNSAVANAEHNAQARADSLFIAKAFVDQGPTLKRMRPRAFGRAATIRKRTSHITVVLSDKQTKAEDSKSPKSQTPNPKQSQYGSKDSS